MQKKVRRAAIGAAGSHCDRWWEYLPVDRVTEENGLDNRGELYAGMMATVINGMALQSGIEKL
jgi:uridylate kinase